MGDEDDCFSPYKCVRLFPSENEWPWSLSEEDVPGASLERSDPSSCSLITLKTWLKCRGISSTNMNKAKAVEVVEKAMKNDHLMSQPIVDPQYPHFTDKKIMKLRQSGDLNEGILKVFPSLKPPMFPSKSVKWETSDDISQETSSYLKNFNHKTILNYYAVMADQRHTGFHNRALMRGIQHHAAGHVRDLSFCLKDPSEIELIENGLYVLASVQASMKNAQYQTKLSLYQYEPLSRKIKIRYAECTCVAG